MNGFIVREAFRPVASKENVSAVEGLLHSVLKHTSTSKVYAKPLEVEFCVVKDNLILGIKCSDTKLKRRIFDNIFDVCKEKTGLQFCLVYPEKETFYCLHERYSTDRYTPNFIDIYSVYEGFDPNFSGCYLKMFGRRYTVRFVGYDAIFERGIKHIDLMKASGIKTFKWDQWHKYCEVFRDTYKLNLIDAFVKTFY